MMFDKSLIIKNTLFLYMRMILLMCIAFYTSRVVLHSLGEVDFGISNVVGGLASTFVFFRSSLSNVTQRFLSIELGRNNVNGAKNVYCQHLTIYIGLALFVIICAETLGLWFVRHKLVIPADRMYAATWVFHFTVVSFAATIISVVFDSLLIAHENMKIYSYVGVVEGILKLSVAYIISHVISNRLIVYQLLLFCISIGLLLFYAIYCRLHYEECRFHFYWNKSDVRHALSMVGWNTVGTFVWAVNDQGINILLNLFFGPAINAARGISFQLSTAIGNFSENLQTAVQPQIVKSYASNDMHSVVRLFTLSSKFSVFLLWFFCLPVILCIDNVLDIWLCEVPEYANIFCIWTLLFYLINALNRPVWTIALATGDLKRYIIWGSIVYLMAFPISYICLARGCSPVSVFICVVVARIIYSIITFLIINQKVTIPIKPYIRQVILPICIIIGLSWTVGYYLSILLPSSLICTMITVMSSWAIFAFLLFTVGLSSKEIDTIKNFVKSKISK